ncbi:MAG: helix-turn-helix domain-containing protein [Halanaeroarchaeum sp.]
MSVIVDLTLPAENFELGRILEAAEDRGIYLETLVPLGGRPTPFFRVPDADTDFEAAIRDRLAVDTVEPVESRNGETVYALKWDVRSDAFVGGLLEQQAAVLDARGVGGTWQFELRFPSHEALERFQEYCRESGIDVEIHGLYNPTEPGAGPSFGLTPEQSATLARAVEAGYYSIPRRISTRQLAAEFGISDQAVTERLRRAIENLVRNTLVHAKESSAAEVP